MRRKAKRPIPWVSVLAGALGVNAIAGLCLSPATAVRRVKVSGDPGFLEKEIQKALDPLVGMPALLINPHAVESRVQSLPGVCRATFNRSIFGTARLLVAIRTPVAGIYGKPGWFLDTQGVLFPSRGIQELTLSIKLPEEAWRPVLAFCEPWPSGSVASVCEKLKNLDGLMPGRLEIDASGSVSLWSGTGMRLVFGSPDDLEAKFAKLRELLDANPNLFEQAARLDLTIAKQPMLVPKTGRK